MKKKFLGLKEILLKRIGEIYEAVLMQMSFWIIVDFRRCYDKWCIKPHFNKKWVQGSYKHLDMTDLETQLKEAQKKRISYPVVPKVYILIKMNIYLIMIKGWS